MDRNPSPPPPSRDKNEEEEVAGGDCIGSTVYSKHWLFGVLSGLIQVWKLASRVGSPSVPQSPRPPLWQRPPARGAATPTTAPPRARAPGPARCAS